MENSTKKVSFIKSIKFRIMVTALAAAIFTAAILGVAMLRSTRATLKDTNGNYLLDIATISTQLLNEELSLKGEDVAMQYDELNKIFAGLGIKGIDSSYAYVVSSDGTMVYHPTESKVGSPVENDCVKTVVSNIASGSAKAGDSEFVAYLYKGADKYAGYMIADNMSIVVVTADEDDIMATQTELMYKVFAIEAIILAIIVLASIYIANHIAKPIITVTGVIGNAGELDFSYSDAVAKLKTRGDETGVMANAVDTMQAKMADVINSISNSGNVLKESSDGLSNIASETSTTIEQVEKAVAEIADGAGSQAEETQKATESVILMGNMVEETNLEVERLSSTADVMKQSGKNASDTLKELESINEKTMASINVIYEQTNTTNASANKIREATDLITSIAEETNLLSLNASIEAARAGDQGRGFAVVASQISKLAEQSSESARLIENIINSLIEDSGKSVATMEEVKDIMKVQFEKVNATVEMFKEVQDGIDTSINGIGNIADKTKKLDEARITVVDVVQNLTAIAEENAASTQETSASVTEVSNIVYNLSENAKKLDNVASELQEKVKLFTV